MPRLDQRRNGEQTSKSAFVNDYAGPKDTVHAAANASSAEWVFSKGKKARKCAYIPFGGGLPRTTPLYQIGAAVLAGKESNILLLFPEYEIRAFFDHPR